MPKVIIYTSSMCGYCYRAKQLLRKKAVDFIEHSVDFRPDIRQEMRQKSGRNSVPQIWINDQHVGGCDDLYALEHNGQLDALLRTD